MRLAIRKAKKLALGMGISKSKAKKTAEYASAEEDRKCLAADTAGEDENHTRGNHQ